MCILHRVKKPVKFTATNFTGRSSVKYFMQAQLLRSCNSFFPSLVRNNYYINTFSPCEEEDTNTVDRTSNK